MLPIENTAEYLSVSLPTSPDSLVIISVCTVGLAGFLLMMGVLISGGRVQTAIFGGAALVFAIGAYVPLQGVVIANAQTIENHMKENIKTKYKASLELESSKGLFANATDLDQKKKYKLVFEDGASGEYEMYFKETGEPVVVVDAASANQAPAGVEASAQ